MNNSKSKEHNRSMNQRIAIVEANDFKVSTLVVEAVIGMPNGATYNQKYYLTNLQNSLQLQEQVIQFGTGTKKCTTFNLSGVKLSPNIEMASGVNIAKLLNGTEDQKTLFLQRVESLLKRAHPTGRVTYKVVSNVDTIQIYNEAIPTYNYIRGATENTDSVFAQLYDIVSDGQRLLCTYDEFANWALSANLIPADDMVKILFYYKLSKHETTAARIQSDINRFGTDELKASMQNCSGIGIENICIIPAGLALQRYQESYTSIAIIGDTTVPIQFITEDELAVEDQYFNLDYGQEQEEEEETVYVTQKVENDVEIQPIATVDNTDDGATESPKILTWSRGNS